MNNKNEKMQNKICDLLTSLCLNLYDYKTDFCQKYGIILSTKLQKEKSIQGLIGIIKLIDNIYSASSNFGGKIPQKEGTHTTQDPCELFHFCCPALKKRI